MKISLVSVVAVACSVALLISCDEPTVPEQTLIPSLSQGLDPNAPSSLTAAAAVAPTAQINLTWTDNSHNETGFQILRSSTGSTGSFSALATTLASVTTYSDADLHPVNEYCYKVQAVAKSRIIGISSTACAKPPTPPAASNASAAPQGSLVNITWTDNSVIESGFRIEVAPASTGPWTPSGAVGANVTSTQRAAPGEVEVCYHVIAFSDLGDAAPSNPACVTPLAAPTLTATTLYDREVELHWSPNSTEDWYEVSRSIGAGEWLVLATPYRDVLDFVDEGLSVGTSYSYRVRAMKVGGYSEFSNTVTVTAANGSPKPPTVYTYVFSSDAISNDAIEVYWPVPAGFADGSSIVTGWRVEKSTYPFSTWTEIANAADVFNNGYYAWYDDYGLTLYETVCYRVFALSRFGESAPAEACDTPYDYCDYSCYGGAARVVSPLLSPQTELLSFRTSKSPKARGADGKNPKPPVLPLTNRLRRRP